MHPTKKQVNFYKFGDLFEEMLKWMEKLLQESGTVKYIDTGSRISQHSLMELQSKYREKFMYTQPKNTQTVNNSQNSLNSQSSLREKERANYT